MFDNQYGPWTPHTHIQWIVIETRDDGVNKDSHVGEWCSFFIDFQGVGQFHLCVLSAEHTWLSQFSLDFGDV